jgi:glycerol-3-phosphate O-acyltransferase
MRAVAARVIWFEPPEKALADTPRFVAYAMRYASHADMKSIRKHLSDADFLRATEQSPPGIVDPRSWTYWNLKLGRTPAPPPPKRALPD